jgi:hypothetical protein
MEIRLQTRALLLVLASATAVLGQTDVREIIRRAAAADERNWKIARNYTFSERVNLRYLDSQGRVKSQEVSLSDVLLLDGSPYSRLVARDDRPLPPAKEEGAGKARQEHRRAPGPDRSAADATPVRVRQASRVAARSLARTAGSFQLPASRGRGVERPQPVRDRSCAAPAIPAP